MRDTLLMGRGTRINKRAPAKRNGRLSGFDLKVDTMPVRGLVCAMTESLLAFALLKSPDTRQDGSLVAAVELGAYAHAANDAPKKYSPKEVFNQARLRLRSS